MAEPKITTIDELASLLQGFQGSIGLIGGCFDVLHYGHIELLEFGKSHVDKLIVGLESDSYIKFHKGKDRPIFQQNIRAKVLSAISFVDHVLLIDYGKGATAEKISSAYVSMIKKLNVTAVITNERTDATWEIKKGWCKSLGIDFICQNTEKVSSSTHIIEELSL